MKYLLVADFGDCKLKFEVDFELDLMLAIEFFVDCFYFANDIYFYEYDNNNNIVGYKRILKNED